MATVQGAVTGGQDLLVNAILVYNDNLPLAVPYYGRDVWIVDNMPKISGKVVGDD